jgi:cytosine/adenosine deaminase-related metal-dependent hydrolase
MLVITAKWVLPISSSPLVNGEVEVVGSTITYCGPRRNTTEYRQGAVFRDLGDAIIMPGLVNVHTHIEYTFLRGFLEDISFFPWVRALTQIKSRYQREDWFISGLLGALECIESGITTIGDNSDSGVTAEIAAEYGLRARVYQEVFGIDNREPWEPILADLDTKLQRIAAHASDRVEMGVSPHALYTVRPDLMHGLVNYCETNKLKTSIHIAESLSESDLCMNGHGEFADMFERRGITWKSPGCTPTRYAYDLGALNANTLAVHCVQQNADDIELIAKSGASIAHCPKSNAKLAAGIAPLTQWLNNVGLADQIGLGTDSAVSNNTHDIFEEMRFGLFAQRSSSSQICLDAKQMVDCATIGGARALGWDDRIGTLDTGKKADLIAVKLDTLHNSPATDPYSALVYSSRADDICLTMVDGRILYDNHKHINIDSENVREQAIALRQKTAHSTS